MELAKLHIINIMRKFSTESKNAPGNTNIIQNRKNETNSLDIIRKSYRLFFWVHFIMKKHSQANVVCD
jgi:hypothetical protein